MNTVRGLVESIKFLFTGPLILIMLGVVDWMTPPPGLHWFYWAALGIGIGWFFSLLRVVWAVVVFGGLAALFAYLQSRKVRIL